MCFESPKFGILSCTNEMMNGAITLFSPTLAGVQVNQLNQRIEPLSVKTLSGLPCTSNLLIENERADRGHSL